jgi:hypothetical protein
MDQACPLIGDVAKHRGYDLRVGPLSACSCTYMAVTQLSHGEARLGKDGGKGELRS